MILLNDQPDTEPEKEQRQQKNRDAEEVKSVETDPTTEEADKVRVDWIGCIELLCIVIKDRNRYERGECEE